MLKDIIYNTSVQKILYFLLSNPGEKYYDREIARLSGVSRAATNFALHDLMEAGLVAREKKGRMYFYNTDLGNNLIRHFKIIQNLIIINPLLEKMKLVSLKIILYGSTARGENYKNSDIDLFVLTRESQKVKNLIYKNPLRESIQITIKKPHEFAKLKKDNPVFLREISNGIVLYEEK